MAQKLLHLLLPKIKFPARVAAAHFELLLLLAVIIALGSGLFIFWNFSWKPTTIPPAPATQPRIVVPQAPLDEALGAIAERDARYAEPPATEAVPDIFR